MKIVHEHVGLVECVCRRDCLLGSDIVEGNVDAQINGSSIIVKGTIDGLDSHGAGFVERLGD